MGLDGKPARWHFAIQLGTGADGESCPHCHQPVKRDWKLDPEGVLRDGEGKEVVPREEARKVLAELNGFHARMDKHMARQKALGSGTRK